MERTFRDPKARERTTLTEADDAFAGRFPCGNFSARQSANKRNCVGVSLEEAVMQSGLAGLPEDIRCLYYIPIGVSSRAKTSREKSMRLVVL